MSLEEKNKNRKVIANRYLRSYAKKIENFLLFNFQLLHSIQFLHDIQKHHSLDNSSFLLNESDGCIHRSSCSQHIIDNNYTFSFFENIPLLLNRYFCISIQSVPYSRSYCSRTTGPGSLPFFLNGWHGFFTFKQRGIANRNPLDSNIQIRSQLTLCKCSENNSVTSYRMEGSANKGNTSKKLIFGFGQLSHLLLDLIILSTRSSSTFFMLQRKINLYLFLSIYILFNNIVMQKPKVTFGTQPLPMSSVPPNLIAGPSHGRPSNIVVQHSRVSPSPIRPPQLIDRTGMLNQPPLEQEPKKVDINLNIHVDGDGTVTANTNSDTPNIYVRPSIHQQQPVYQNFNPHYGMIPNTSQQPFPQYHPHPQHFLQKPAEHQTPLEQSKLTQKMSYSETMVEDSVYCVICNEEYSESQRDQHIKKHQKSYENGMTRIKSKEVLGKFTTAQEPVMRPIVQPEEYNVQYEPHMLVLEKEYKEKDGVINDYEIKVNHQSSLAHEKPSIFEQKREEQIIRLSLDDAEQIEVENYSQHRMYRKNKEGNEVSFEKNDPSFMDKERFVRESVQKEEANEPLRVSQQNHRETIKDFGWESYKDIGRETIILENEDQQMRDLEDSNYRRASVRKRVYNSGKYSEDKSKMDKEATPTKIVPIEEIEADKFENPYQSSAQHKRTYQTVNYQQTQSVVHPISSEQIEEVVEAQKKKSLVQPSQIQQSSQRRNDTSRAGEMKGSLQVFESQRNNQQFAKYLRDSNPFQEQYRQSQLNCQPVKEVQAQKMESSVSQKSKQSSQNENASERSKSKTEELHKRQYVTQVRPQENDEFDRQSISSRRSKQSKLSRRSQVSESQYSQQESQNGTSFKKKRLPVVHQL